MDRRMSSAEADLLRYEEMSTEQLWLLAETLGLDVREGMTRDELLRLVRDGAASVGTGTPSGGPGAAGGSAGPQMGGTSGQMAGTTGAGSSFAGGYDEERDRAWRAAEEQLRSER